MVRDQDEHGDGLADLQQINQRPSRTGLSSFFSSNTSLERLNSSASSRANSFSSASIPAWAKLYYGSGERRYLGAPSISTSESGSRAGSIFRGGSPANDHFPLNIYSSRKRAREVQPGGQRPFSDSASMDIAPYQPHEGYHQISRGMKKKTSSIWSPHLRMDRRASRYSIWEPPSVNWSAESGMWGRRNIQVVMFIVGFVFPFAWMIAAFLPLPPNPKLEMAEVDYSQSQFGVSHDFTRHNALADEIRYQSAKWWRTLNRGMAVIGVLVVAAIITLVVLAVKQGWAR